MLRRRKPTDPDELGAAIREAIRRMVEQRERVRIDAGRAFVNYAGVEHAIDAQRGHLAAARVDIEEALAAARAAGERAGAEALAAARHAGLDEEQAQAAAHTAAAPYQHASAGLQHQGDVIDGTAEQLEAAAAAAAGEITRARALLAASAASLDAALKEQVALLGRLERAERARVIARARRSQP